MGRAYKDWSPFTDEWTHYEDPEGNIHPRPDEEDLPPGTIQAVMIVPPTKIERVSHFLWAMEKAAMYLFFLVIAALFSAVTQHWYYYVLDAYLIYKIAQKFKQARLLESRGPSNVSEVGP